MLLSSTFHLLHLLAASTAHALHNQHPKAIHAHHEKRQTSAIVFTTITDTTATTYTLITPSPSAIPIPITSQSQVITSYIPLLTLCAPDQSTTSSLPKWGNSSSPTSSTPSSTRDCTTHYKTVNRTVCATVLTGLASQVTVSRCSQPITFSSAYGYLLDLPAPTSNSASTATGNNATAPAAPTPTIQTQTSFYIAPWQALLPGTTPGPLNITQKICSFVSTSLRSCVDVHEMWATETITHVTSITSSVDLTTTLSGPSQLIIETLTAEIRETLTTLSLQTVLVVVSSAEAVRTVRRTVRTVTSTGVGRTATATVKSKDVDTTSTITVVRTSTIFMGTVTRTTSIAGAVPLV